MRSPKCSLNAKYSCIFAVLWETSYGRASDVKGDSFEERTDVEYFFQKQGTVAMKKDKFIRKVNRIRILRKKILSIDLLFGQDLCC